jgi:hypothetical protein
MVKGGVIDEFNIFSSVTRISMSPVDKLAFLASRSITVPLA